MAWETVIVLYFQAVHSLGCSVWVAAFRCGMIAESWSKLQSLYWYCHLNSDLGVFHCRSEPPFLALKV